MARLREFDYEETLSKAGRQFWAYGYQATSIQDITSITGVKPGSLYKAFGDKKGLFLKCIEHYMKHSSLKAVLVEDFDAPLKESFSKLFNLIVESCADDERISGCLVTNSAYELASVDKDIFGELMKYLKQMQQTVRCRLLLAQEAGELGDKHDVDSLTAYYMTLIQGLLVSSRVSKDQTGMRQAIQIGLDLLD